MKETLANLELSKLAKDKGFDWEVRDSYSLNPKSNNHLIDEDYLEDWNSVGAVSAPSLSLLQKWLREVHNIDIEVSIYGILHKKPEGYKVTVYSIKTVLFSWKTGGIHKSYEDALEAGLLTALEYIENENKL